LTVTAGGKDLAHGRTLAEMRSATAAAARAELDLRARERFGQLGSWRRFEIEELPASLPLALDEGSVCVFPALHRNGEIIDVRYEWSAAEAARTSQQGSAHLARTMLASQARDLAKIVAGNASLMLAASPFGDSRSLIDALLHGVFRRACFGENAAPATREAFEGAVDQGRARLHACLEEAIAAALRWYTEARAVRRLQNDASGRLPADAAAESHEHLGRMLNASSLESATPDQLRQLPRYLKAEAQRWQRIAARGGEPAHIVRELRNWSARHQSLAQRLNGELRWIPQLDELQSGIEEYRVSLYAQELKTLGPISAARLQQRAAEIEAWITR
jgi:ATP-dependent helicase HrpA